ncbi:MAG: prephenate dehydrogenase/arogenate dehydrogenase family protein [Proteobacteria bacterium]|nr:MAG: prephenate dehydrogenase/arogenate dehydrogenase family protein [Pseudomonadota bacterium]QKK12474.1 MAG: prephenate dehydrogenase/arogenate dehydrogenase family protein [Pseudomonadota bacterium]
MIERLCIIGVGLIGGSLAAALRAAGAVGHVTGCNRNPASLEKARALGIIDCGETDPARAVAEADVVLVAVPMMAMEGVFQRIAPVLAPETILTDAGSTKGHVVAVAKSAFGFVPPRLVPGHPIAGTEKSGVEAAFPELYRGCRVILTPVAETAPEATARIRWMWEQAGAQVEEMDIEHHDEVLAATSHLPHMLAYSLVDALARMEEHKEIFRFAAGGFRDFTRIASSDPQMWHDICLTNRVQLLRMLDRFGANLQHLYTAIEAGDSASVMAIFKRAKNARDRYCQNASGSPE